MFSSLFLVCILGIQKITDGTIKSLTCRNYVCLYADDTYSLLDTMITLNIDAFNKHYLL